MATETDVAEHYQFTHDEVAYCIKPGYVHILSPSDHVEVDGICGHWLDCPGCGKRCSLTVVHEPSDYRTVMLKCKACNVKTAASAPTSDDPEVLVDSLLDDMLRELAERNSDIANDP